MNINSCVLSGRLTADGEMKTANSGTTVLNFRIAVNDRRSGDSMFLNVVCFGKQAEVLAPMLKKGGLVAVTGRLKIETYEKDGAKRDSVSIYADNVELGPKNEAA